MDGQNEGAVPLLNQSDDILGEPTSQKKENSNVQKFIILLIILLGFLFVLAGFMFLTKGKKNSDNSGQVQEAVQQKPEFTQSNQALYNTSIDRQKQEIREKEEAEQRRLRELEEEAAAMAKETPEATTIQPTQTIAPNTPAGNDTEQPRPLTPYERKLTGNVLLSPTGSRSDKSEDDTVSTPQGASEQDEVYRGNSYGAPENQNGESEVAAHASLSSRLRPTVLLTNTAGKLPHLDFLLKKGSVIPCALKTGIDTTLPGFVMCNVLNDVYSANGKTLLVERGATIFGEQQSALKQGQQRTFVIWTRIDNPSGVFANVNSPATDRMGQSGISGHVNTHFWERFGSAILLSLIDDFSAAYAQRIAGRNGTVNPSQQQPGQATQQTFESMATEALRNSINIPPTLTVLPATVVHVMVARDIDFKEVYGVVE